MEKTKPSNWKYVGVYLLARFIANFLIFMLDGILASQIKKNSNDQEIYLFLGGMTEVLIWPGIFILVYNMFPTLNIKKVMPYVYCFGIIGIMKSIVQVTVIVDPSTDLSVFYFSTITSFLASFIAIRMYYIRKPDRWY